MASALDYLHNHFSDSIVHCDIKPSNILLDGQMVAHLGDFGLAKLLRSTSSVSNQTSSVGVRGTVGYIAPEYATGSEVSTLGDIYSMFKDDFNLNSFASAELPYCITEIVDPVILQEEDCDDQDQAVFKSLVSIIKIGVACSSKVPGQRMNIGDVDTELHRRRDALAQYGSKPPFPQ